MLRSIVRTASRVIAVVFMVTVIVHSARADVIVSSFSDIQYWVGTGSNQAAFVVDWNDGTATESYTWGYRWNGVSTGEDMLRAIDQADSRLTIGLQFFTGLGSSFSSGRYDVDGNGSSDHAFDDSVDSGYWSYWIQETSAPFASGAWSFSDNGMSTRMLANGSWDGWSWAAGPSFEEPGNNGPDAGVAAVPEPGVPMLAALGGVLLGWSFRRQTSKRG